MDCVAVSFTGRWNSYFAFFLVSLFVEHRIADKLKKGLPFLDFSRAGSCVFGGLVLFTISKVAGAVVWGATELVAVLAMCSTVEHYVARNVAKIKG